MKRSITVTIAGQRYALKSDADESYVQLLAGIVDERMRELHAAGKRGVAGEVAVLAALRIADELVRERQKRSDLRRRVRAQAAVLVGEIAALRESAGLPSAPTFTEVDGAAAPVAPMQSSATLPFPASPHRPTTAPVVQAQGPAVAPNSTHQPIDGPTRT